MSVSQRLRVWRLRLRSLVRRDTLDSEVQRELAFHFDQLVSEKIDEGLSPREARIAAHRLLGNVAALEELCRDERRVSWAYDFRQDLAYGVRIFRKQPGLTIIAVLSLALGIGANTAVLGAYDALLVRALPVAHSDRLVAIQSMPLDNPGQLSNLSLQDYAAIRDRSRSFDMVEAAITWSSDLRSDAPGEPPERVTGQRVTPGWLSALGVAPLVGQIFTETAVIEGPDSASSVIVISHEFWQRRFGADPAIVNRQIRLQGGPKTIIGVMPADFQYQRQGIDYWAPLAVASQPDPGARLFGVRARLRADVPLARAQAELSTLASNLERERPANKGWGWQVRPLNEALFGWAREPLIVFELAVGLVLLIAVANVAALLLSRATIREREMALRTALGAARGRLIRQLLAESMLLAVGGGVVGVVVAVVGQRALVEMQGPPGAPALTAIGLNFRVLGLLALLSISAGLACGLVPAIRSSRRNPIGALQQSGPGIGAARQPVFARGMLVALQLALALILLIGSGLLLNSLVRLVQRDLNFDPQGLVRLDYAVPPAQSAQPIGKYNGFPYFEFRTPPSQKLQQVLEQLRTVSGAEAVAGISAPPVDSFVLATPDVRLDSAGDVKTGAAYFIVTPNLFQTIRTTIVNGRDFSDRDTAGTPWVVVVNETCARLFWPDGHPIGKHVMLDIVPEEQPREVVGVVRDIPTRHAEPPQPVIYASYLQQPTRYRAPWVNLLGQITFMIRTTGDTQAVISGARHAVAQIDPDRSLVDVSTVLSHMRNATGRFRDYVLLVTILAFVATLLAAIGTYGVMSYAVSQHTREIGIRRALGAGRREVVRFVGRSALIVVGIGLVAGLTGALLLTRLIASQLWGVTSTDPVTYGGVSIILISVAAIACIVPARRALAVDPTVALRTD